MTTPPDPTPAAGTTPAADAAGHSPADRPTGARADGIATLAGDGTVGAFRAVRGGSVTPGNGIGTLHVLHDAVFDRGSQYNVEVADNGRSDKIEARRAFLYGGSVNVSQKNRKNLLSQNEAQSLLGNKYTILTTTDGVTGRFENANPSYPFVNVTLDYQGNDVGLGITRTAARFDSLASTENEKAVARASERGRF